MADVKEHIDFDVEFTDNIKEASSDFERMQRIFDQTNKKMEKLSETSNKSVKSITALGDAAKKAFEEAARAVDTDEENFKSFTNQVEKTATAMTALKKAMDAIDKSGNSDAFAKQRESLEAMYNSAKSANELSSAWLDEYMRKTVANTGKGGASVPSRSAAEQKKIQDAALKEMTSPEKVKAYQEAAPKHKAPVKEEEVKSVSKELDGLEQDIDNITKKFNDMFASGDRKGMKEAVQDVEQLKQRIADMKATDGIGEDDLARLKELESRLSSVVAESGKEIRKRVFSGLKSAIDGAGRLALAALKRGYSTAVRLTKSWLNIMNRTFKTILGVWQKLLSKVFSKNSGGSLLGNQLKGMLGVASIAGLAALSKQMIGLSADMFEVQNVIEGVFGSAEQEISDFCDTSIEKFGLTGLEARKLAGIFGGILKASHIVGDAQQEMSKNLTALSGDIASFYNISVDEASSKLQSGLVGNVSAMRSLGINMTVANLEAYALSKGITTSWQSLDQATKTTLRYNYILEQTRAAQGDYAKTFGSWANQVRLLTSNLKQLASIIGGALIKVLYPVLSLLNQIVSAAINAANALAKAFNFQAVDLAKMFGGSGGVKLPDTSDYEEGMEDVAGATNDAADATAKLNDNLQSFDRLNNISSPTATKAGGVSTGISSGVGGLLDFDSYYKKVKEPNIVVNEKLQKVLDVIKQWVKDVASVDYRNIKSAWKNLSDAFEPVAEDIGKSIQWLWKNVLFPFYTWAATQGAPAAINLLAEALRALHAVAVAVAPDLDNFWKNTLAPYFSAKGESFTTTLQNWTKELKEWTKGLQDADDKTGYLKDTVTSAKDALYAWIGDTFITDRLDSIGGHIEGIWGNLKDGSVSSNVKSILSAFTKLSLVVFDNILKMIETLSADENVGEFIDFLAEQFGELADATFDSIIELIQYLAKSDTFKDTIKNIKEAIINIIKYVVDHKEEITEFLHGVSEVIKWLSEHLGAVKVLAFGLLGSKAIGGIGKTVSSVTKLKGAVGLLKKGLISLKGTKAFTAIAGSAKGLFSKIATGAKSGISTLSKTVFPGIKSALSGLLGGGGTGLASKLAATGHSLGGTLAAAVVAGVGGWKIGSKIYDTWGDEIEGAVFPVLDAVRDRFAEAKKELKFGDTEDSFSRKLREVSKDESEMALRANDLARAQKRAFKFDPNTEIFTDYANKITKATNAFNDLDENIRNVIVNGREDNWKGMTVSVDDLQDSVYGYAAALRDAGYANEDLLGKLEDLSFKNVGLFDVSGKQQLKDDIIATYQEIMYDVEAERNSVMQMSEAQFRDAFFPEGYTVKLQEAAGNAVNAMKNGAVSAIVAGNPVRQALQSKLTSSIAAVTSVAAQQSIPLGAATVMGIDTGIKSKSANISSALRLTLTAAKTGAQAVIGQFTTIGSYSAEGVAQGMRSRAASIASAAQSIISSAAAAMRAAAQIHSPSRLFADIAQYIPEGVAVGINDNTYVVSDAMSSMVNSMEQDVLANQVDMSGIIDASRFSDKYRDILYQTEDFNKEMSKYGDMTPAEYQSSMLTSPRVKQAQLSANIAQSGVSTLSEGISALYGEARGARGDTGKVIQCQIVVGSTQFAQFIIDTVTGQAIQTGNF